MFCRLFEKQESFKKEFERTQGEIEKLQQELADAEKAYQALVAKKEELDALSKSITTLENLLPKFALLAALTKEIEAQTVDKRKKEAEAERLEKTRVAASDQLGQSQERLEQLKDAGVKAAQLERSVETLQKKLNDTAELEELIAQHQTLVRQLEEKQQQVQQAIAAKDKAAKRYSELSAAFLAEQAGILAGTLVSGAPCPVCGSVEHPRPAKLSEKAPTESDVKSAKSLSEKADAHAANLASEAAALLTKTEDLKAQIESKGKKLFEDFAPERVAQLCAREKKACVAQKSEAQVLLAEEKEKQKQKESLEAKIPALRETISRMESQIAQLKAELAALTSTLAEKSKQIRSLKEELGFESAAAAEEKLTAQRSALKAGLEAIESAKKQCEELDKKLHNLRGTQKGLKKAIKEAVSLNIDELRRKQAQANDAKKAADDLKEKIFSAVDNNSKLLRSIRERSAELIEIEARCNWLTTLSQTVNGNLSSKEKIRLETYVQMMYFDRIIQRANTRLLAMTNGQYELLRRKQSGQNQSQTGLDLDVLDHYNGSTRSVKSLSGGESFKASLALALGLSDEIQCSAGGIELDTMFIDEGFGSLDDDSLESAIKVLVGMTGTDRLVGIISHVEKLKEKIDKKIVVRKSRRSETLGSTLEIVIE